MSKISVLLSIFIVLTLTACATPQPPSPTPSATSTAVPTETITPTPTSTPIPATPEGAEGLRYDPESESLLDPQNTPVYRLNQEEKWEIILPQEFMAFKERIESSASKFEVREDGVYVKESKGRAKMFDLERNEDGEFAAVFESGRYPLDWVKGVDEGVIEVQRPIDDISEFWEGIKGELDQETLKRLTEGGEEVEIEEVLAETAKEWFGKDGAYVEVKVLESGAINVPPPEIGMREKKEDLPVVDWRAHREYLQNLRLFEEVYLARHPEIRETAEGQYNFPSSPAVPFETSDMQYSFWEGTGKKSKFIDPKKQSVLGVFWIDRSEHGEGRILAFGLPVKIRTMNEEPYRENVILHFGMDTEAFRKFAMSIGYPEYADQWGLLGRVDEADFNVSTVRVIVEASADMGLWQDLRWLYEIAEDEGALEAIKRHIYLTVEGEDLTEEQIRAMQESVLPVMGFPAVYYED